MRYWPIVKRILRKKTFWGFFVIFLLVVVRFWQEYKSVMEEPVGSWQSTTQADCAVVLTGGAGRVREGFDLLANQSVKKLIISGVNPNVQLREIMPAWTFYGPLRESDVILERHSETTYGNAQQSLAIVEALRCRDVILVTSRLHMFRSYNTFREIFPPNIPIYKHAVVSGKYWRTRDEAMTEAFKSLFYSTWVY